MAEYFARRLELLDVGAVALDVVGASIAFDNRPEATNSHLNLLLWAVIG